MTDLAPAPTSIPPVVGPDGKVDLVPLISELSIVTKGGKLLRLGDSLFNPDREPQRHLLRVVNNNINARRPTRVIILKARQLGMSTIVEGLMFLFAFLMKYMNGIVISQDGKGAAKLLNMTHHYWATCPWREAYSEKSRRVDQLRWEETDSWITITTSKTLGSGRGQTIQFLHGSECGFWERDPATLWGGLSEAIPETTWRSFVFLESTANGVGNWWESMWNDAVEGQNDFTPLFFPWQTHEEYRASSIGIVSSPQQALELLGNPDERERALIAMFSESRLPPEVRKVMAHTYERAEIEALATPMSMAEIADCLLWRRHIIRNKKNGDALLFAQEYPCTPEEAFLSTGHNMFPLEDLRACYEPEEGVRGELAEGSGGQVVFKEGSYGHLTLFRKPDRHALYVLGADPTRALDGDYACIQVLNRRTWEQVAVYRARVEGPRLGEELIRLGKFFNFAEIGCERQGGGEAAVGVLVNSGYENLYRHRNHVSMRGVVDNQAGFHANAQTKPLAVGNMRHAIVTHLTRMHHSETFNESKGYVYLGQGKFGNGTEENHDDCVSAYMIALQVIIEGVDEIAEADAEDHSEAWTMIQDMNERIRSGEMFGTVPGGVS